MDSLQLAWDMLLGFFQIMLLFWPVTAVIVGAMLIRLGVYLYKRHRYTKAGIADVDRLDGKQFEEYLEVFFKQRGYQVQRTPYQGDFGADLVLRKDNVKTVVQAKRYKSTVGVKAVQEAVASKEYYRCDKAMVVTNSYFSNQAKTLAKANQVELWDRDQLVAHLLTLSKPTTHQFAAATELLPNQVSTHQKPTAQIPTAKPTFTQGVAPICAICGKEVSAKVHDYCMAHPNRFHGQTYCYEHQKAAKSFSIAS